MWRENIEDAILKASISDNHKVVALIWVHTTDHDSKHDNGNDSHDAGIQGYQDHGKIWHKLYNSPYWGGKAINDTIHKIMPSLPPGTNFNTIQDAVCFLLSYVKGASNIIDSAGTPNNVGWWHDTQAAVAAAPFDFNKFSKWSKRGIFKKS